MTIELKTQRQKLAELWKSLVPSRCPTDYQFNLWLQLHDMDVDLIAWGIKELACKYHRRNGQMDQEYMVKFVSSVVNRRAETKKLITQRNATELKLRSAHGTEFPHSRIGSREDQQERGNVVR
jgi:hypothetical protein